TEQPLGLADIGATVAHVASSELAVHRPTVRTSRVPGRDQAPKLAVELVQARYFADRDIVYFVQRLPSACRCRQEIGLNGVRDEAEVTTRLTVAIDEDRVAHDDRGGPFRDDRCIGAVEVLSGTEDVEIAQANCVQPIA